ncbi:alpha/beta hydrolase family protein [Telmatobacter sp. DSM 110680]|uniref:Alpha/beta hydrolase family protein n=1 Tax=Telmatobacter sp. DSM 110680 TaxID=3036704 RepID=A0AAU7DSI7_9BACT
MKMLRTIAPALSLLLLVSVTSCRKNPPARPDQPFVAPNVSMQDITFHSPALNRDMPYRVFLPVHIEQGEKLPVVYLLHGGNGGFRDWSNNSQVSRYAAQGLILVMPEGAFSYYMNAAGKTEDRYEDYAFTDLISDVESRFPAANTRDKRAIIGISMGGFAAIKIAFTRPELFGFVAAFSPSIDILHRRYNMKRTGEWWRIRTIFGPWGSDARTARDPLGLVKKAEPSKTPYIYLTVGENEPLRDPNQRFAQQLRDSHFSFEFHIKPGGHDWGEWDSQIPGAFESLIKHSNICDSKPHS